MAIFLNITEISGDSLDQNHRDWIDIDELSHSLEHPQTSGATRGRSRGAPTAGAFELVKGPDLATVKLQEALLTGQTLKTVKVDLTRRGANADVVYLSYELENCSVQSWDLAASESGLAVERITLAFEQLKSAFTPTSARGREGSAVEFGWNFATNEQP